uniref:DNA-(apurinic or apyrimidinic site) endonuclease n=1 Tax=Romanomermis culicivorax TaxID=13658 RepID=A0A915IF57_ROMCU
MKKQKKRKKRKKDKKCQKYDEKNVPNSSRGLIRLEYRRTWNEDFLNYLKKLDAKKPVILCGDLNVAHQEI